MKTMKKSLLLSMAKEAENKISVFFDLTEKYHPVAFNVTSLAAFVPENIEKSLVSKTTDESIHLLTKSRHAASCLMYWLYMAMYHKLITQPQLNVLGKNLIQMNTVLKCLLKYYILRKGLTLSAGSGQAPLAQSRVNSEHVEELTVGTK